MSEKIKRINRELKFKGKILDFSIIFWYNIYKIII